EVIQAGAARKPAPPAAPATPAEAEGGPEGEDEAPAEAPLPAGFDRVAREAVPLQARIKAEPTNPNAYLQLSAHYRRANLLEQARAVLEQGLGPTGNNCDLSIEMAELDLEPFRRNLTVTEERIRSEPQNGELRKIRIRLLKEINTRELDLF